MFVKRLQTVGGLSSLSRYVNMLAGLPRFIRGSTALIFPSDSSPYMEVQNWFNGSVTGFNGKYADPATLPTSSLDSSSWSKTKGYVSVGFGSSPYLRTYVFNDTTGFGSTYSNPASLPAGKVNSIFLDTDNSFIFTAHATTPFMTAYPFSTSSGYGSKVADPATTIGSEGYGVDFLNGTVFASSSGTPFLHAYPFTSSFGTKYANPATLATYAGFFAKVHPSGSAIATGYLDGAVTYAWSNGAGFGTKYAQPAGNPYAYSLAFSATGNTVIMSNQDTPFVNAYSFSISTGYGSKFSNPATLATATPYYNSLAFSNNADSVALLSTASPYVHAYSFSESTGFGTKYSNLVGALAIGSFTGGINFN